MLDVLYTCLDFFFFFEIRTHVVKYMLGIVYSSSDILSKGLM